MYIYKIHDFSLGDIQGGTPLFIKEITVNSQSEK
jgi:hypothetical protein